MRKYYTRACNFFYGPNSIKLVKEKSTLPLCGDNKISFNKIEIFIKNKNTVRSKIVELKNIKNLTSSIRFKVLNDLKIITKKRQFLKINHIY